MRIASVAAAIAIGLWATDAEAGHRWRRGGRHHGNYCHNYSGSSHGNAVSYTQDPYSNCGQSTEWQGGSCGSHHGYGEQSHDNYAASVTTNGCGSHGSHNSAHYGQSNYYGDSGQYGQHQHSQAGQSYETMRPEGQQGTTYSGQEMAPPPPPSYGSQDANSRDNQRRDENNNSDAERNRDANERDSNAASNRNEDSDNRDSDNNDTAADRNENDSTDNPSANTPTTNRDAPASQL